MNTSIDTEISKLKRLNLIAGALHLASLLAILFLANDAKLPVNAIYLTEAPGTGNFSDPINLFNLKIGYMVAAFLALSAFFHFLISSPAMFGKYTVGLKNHINVFRWVEYSLSSTIMIIVILQLNGTADYIALMGIAGVNVCMILFGWLQEKYTTPGDGDLLPFWFGCIAGIVPWLATLVNILSPKGPAESTTPGFVYGIVISLFLLFNCFAIVQYKQYKAQGKWANYLRGERTYIILSLVAKSLL
ncbi:MAG: heliorhodopsin HeR, partial [Ilumatobacteraceae bacterium]